MLLHKDAGTLPKALALTNIPKLITAYFTQKPNTENLEEAVVFGTSGHRGSSFNRTFNENHVLAISQAVAELREATGPLFLGMDTHALSEPAFVTALEVLAANNVHVLVQQGGGYTPTPGISHAILCYNAGREQGLADGIVITPSHNPPQDGGFKYNPASGGPADTSFTSRIEARANALLMEGLNGVKRMGLDKARSKGLVQEFDMAGQYCNQLGDILDMQAIAASGLKLGVHPLGGASVEWWARIAELYHLPLEIVSSEVDPTFRFIPLDYDGKIRMDCSSPYAMHQLLELKDRYDVSFACDPDSDRHGIVCPTGLMNPNHYVCVAADYLYRTRTLWPSTASVGKTVVTTAILGNIAADLKRPLLDVPVGFKWFVEGLFTGTCAFGCEESAGASFLRKNGRVWSTDKDGIILGLLAAELYATTGKSPATYYAGLTERYGAPLYERLDSPADPAIKAALKSLKPENVKLHTLAGFPVTHVYTHAPGNNAPIGGVKVETEKGWFAARPSGTENICKLYCEGFNGPEHFAVLKKEAQAFLEGLR